MPTPLQFVDAIEEVRFDKSVRAVILKSDVPKVFCAGAGRWLNMKSIHPSFFFAPSPHNHKPDLKERLTMTQSDVGSAVFLLLVALILPTVSLNFLSVLSFQVARFVSGARG